MQRATGSADRLLRWPASECWPVHICAKPRVPDFLHAPRVFLYLLTGAPGGSSHPSAALAARQRNRRRRRLQAAR